MIGKVFGRPSPFRMAGLEAHSLCLSATVDTFNLAVHVMLLAFPTKMVAAKRQY